MRKSSKKARAATTTRAKAGVTIGIDLGDKPSYYCLLDEAGKVIVADAREFSSGKSYRKNDRNEAERLARYAPVDPQALHPVQLRSIEQQVDLFIKDPAAECVGCARARGW